MWTLDPPNVPKLLWVTWAINSPPYGYKLWLMELGAVHQYCKQAAQAINSFVFQQNFKEFIQCLLLFSSFSSCSIINFCYFLTRFLCWLKSFKHRSHTIHCLLSYVVVFPLPAFGWLLPLPSLHRVLPHVERSLLSMQLVVESTGIADWRSWQVPPPQAGAASRTVRAPGVWSNYQLARLKLNKFEILFVCLV